MSHQAVQIELDSGARKPARIVRAGSAAREAIKAALSAAHLSPKPFARSTETDLTSAPVLMFRAMDPPDQNVIEFPRPLVSRVICALWESGIPIRLTIDADRTPKKQEFSGRHPLVRLRGALREACCRSLVEWMSQGRVPVAAQYEFPRDEEWWQRCKPEVERGVESSRFGFWWVTGSAKSARQLANRLEEELGVTVAAQNERLNMAPQRRVTEGNCYRNSSPDACNLWLIDDVVRVLDSTMFSNVFDHTHGNVIARRQVGKQYSPAEELLIEALCGPVIRRNDPQARIAIVNLVGATKLMPVAACLELGSPDKESVAQSAAVWAEIVQRLQKCRKVIWDEAVCALQPMRNSNHPGDPEVPQVTVLVRLESEAKSLQTVLTDWRIETALKEAPSDCKQKISTWAAIEEWGWPSGLIIRADSAPRLAVETTKLRGVTSDAQFLDGVIIDTNTVPRIAQKHPQILAAATFSTVEIEMENSAPVG